jgi:very-short-patch-repair endonuclease
MLKDRAPKARGGVGRARALRRAMSLPEVLLWRALRDRPNGLKFRRQHPTGVFILDFYCGDARLAVEVDGEANGRGDQPDKDAARDDWLAAHGILTLRVPARDVLADLDDVVCFVVAQAVARLPLHHPAAPGGPPPPD